MKNIFPTATLALTLLCAALLSFTNSARAQAPVITSTNNTTFPVGTAGTFTVTASGVPTPSLTLSGKPPAGVTFTPSTGLLAGTPAAGTGGSYPLGFTAANGVFPNAAQNFTLAVNEAPAISSPSHRTFTVGFAGDFTVAASGFPAPSVAIAGTLPVGVTFNPSTRVLSGTPAAGTAGSYPITFIANNVVGAVQQDCTVTVDPAPASITVTTTNNTVDGDTSSLAALAANPGPDGLIGLREAILAANVTGGASIIDLTPATYTFTNADNYWYGPDALPAISSTIVINGNGAKLNRSTATNTPNFRFFYISGGGMSAGLPAGNLTLRDLTINNGLAKGGDSGFGGGGLGAGGVVFNNGALTLERVLLTGNVARGGSSGIGTGEAGGGIGESVPDLQYVPAPSYTSTNWLTFSGCPGQVGGGFGGPFSGAVASLTGGYGPDVPPNPDYTYAGGGGGAGFTASGKPGSPANMPGTDGYSGGPGGGGGMLGGSSDVVSFNTLGLVNTYYIGDGGQGSPIHGGGGGGIGGGGGSIPYRYSNLYVGNGSGGAFGFGGGASGLEPLNEGGGGGFGGGGAMNADGGFGGGGGAPLNAEIFFLAVGGVGGGTGYSSSGGGGSGMGGAVFNLFGTVNIINSTLIGNAAIGGNGGFGGAGFGGAILNLNGTVALTFATLASNTVASGAGLLPIFSQGGNVANMAFGNTLDGAGPVSAAISLTNSILTGTPSGQADLASMLPYTPEYIGYNPINGLYTNTVTVNSVGTNFVGSSSNGFTDANHTQFSVGSGAALSLSNLLGGTLNLGPLTNNGGLTMTLALLPGSSAIGAGVPVSGLATDQRGFVRSSSPSLGAYEFGGGIAPTITSAASAIFTLGGSNSFTVTVAGSPAPGLNVAGTLPTGVTFDPATGRLAGTPAAGTAGTYPLTFTATNGFGSNASQDFTLAVTQSPAITSAASATFTVGVSNSFTLTASGNPAPVFTETSALPTGVTLSAAGVLSGTPAPGTSGTYPITLTASNGFPPNATQSFTLMLIQPQSPLIGTADGAYWYLGPAAVGNDWHIYRQMLGQTPALLDGLAARLGLANDGTVLVKNSNGGVYARIGSTNGFGIGWQLLTSVTAGDGATWFLGADGNGNDLFIYRWAAGGTATYISGAATQLAVLPDGSILARNSGGASYLRVGSNAGLGSGWQLLHDSLVVTTPADENNGTSDPSLGTGTSLREALIYAQTLTGQQTITFAPSLAGQTVTLTNGWNGPGDASALAVSNAAVTIQGPTNSPGITLAIGSGVQRRHFYVAPTGTLGLQNLTLTGGNCPAGGGALFSEGLLNVDACTFTGNYSAQEGGVLWNYGVGTQTQIRNSTFAGNTSVIKGGAISTAADLTTLTNVTIVDNAITGTIGGAIQQFAGDTRVVNCIIARNTANGAPNNVVSVFTALDATNSFNNLIGADVSGPAGSGLTNGVNGNLVGIADASLGVGTLVNNGGSTPTVALLTGSPAINAGTSTGAPTTDQRGKLRPQFGGVDIGAYEQTPFDTGQTVLNVGGAFWYLGPDAIGNDLSIYYQLPGQLATTVPGAAVRIGQANDGTVLVENLNGGVFARINSTNGIGIGWQLLTSVPAGDGATWFLGPDGAGNDYYIYRWAASGAPTYSDGAATQLSVLPDGSIQAKNSSGNSYLRVGSNTGLGSYWELVSIASAPSALENPTRLSNGAFQFSFTNQPGASFTVLTSTNLALPLSNWTSLGAPIESPAGQYQYTDPAATNNGQRFYRVKSP